MSSSQKSKNPTVSYEDFEPSRLTFTNLEENDRSKGQKIAYPRYDHPTLGADAQLFLQFPPIVISTYGIPRIGEYYPDDKSRSFVKTPLDMNDPKVKLLVDKLKQLDERLGSDEFKTKNFGKKAKKYRYVPFVREAVQDDDDEDEDKPKRPDYLKLKLNLSWPDDKVLTKVFVVDKSSGKKKRTVVEVETVDDVTKYVNWNGTFTPIVRPVKMWAQPSSKKDPEYGFVVKIVKLVAEPSTSGNGSYSAYLDNDEFLSDDDSDEDELNVKDEDDDEDEVVEKTKELQVASDDDDSDSDSESDSDSDDAIVVKKKSKAKSKSKSKSKGK